MNSSPPVLRSDRTLEEAEQFLREHRAVAVPVVTPGGNLVAVLTDFQLLKCFLKRSQQTPNLLFVGNYLSEMDPVKTIDEDESILEAFRQMVASPNHRIIVVKANQITGMLEPSDLFSVMSEKEPKKGERPTKRRTRSEEAAAVPMESLMLAQAPATVHAVDFGGTIQYANKFVHILLGYDDGELIGKTLRDLYPTTSHEDAFNGLLRIRQIGYHAQVNVSMVMKNQELVKIDVVTLLRYDDKGMPAGTVTIGHLDEKAMNEQLKITARALKPKLSEDPAST